MNNFFYCLGILSYPTLHLLNGWMFKFAEFNAHISLIYLPAFLRLFNVLVFGALRGSCITFLGGLLLYPFFLEQSWTFLANDVCSMLGPLIALGLFRVWHTSDVSLRNLKHLIFLALTYTVANASIHHVAWSFLEPCLIIDRVQFFEMLIGDLLGTLLGVFIFKWITDLPYVKTKIYNKEVD